MYYLHLKFIIRRTSKANQTQYTHIRVSSVTFLHKNVTVESRLFEHYLSEHVDQTNTDHKYRFSRTSLPERQLLLCLSQGREALL